MDSLGVYIQIPFCASKCSFCNFSSRVARPEAVEAYSHSLLREIELLPGIHESRNIDSRLLEFQVDTLYVGGGTPALLGEGRIAAIVAALERRFKLAGSVEFTLETTPGSAGEDSLRKLCGLGVNRLSIGAQSFDARELKSVGRLHSPDDTRTLIEQARHAGFRNISLDLIAGLPHQTAASWEASLQAAVELRPEHLSIYLFEIDEKSRLGREVLEQGGRYHAGEVPSEDFMADAYATARKLLSRAGYVQYEISNFALPGYESRHNRKYWRLDPYVGLGAGAHSFNGSHRWSNEPAAEIYQERLSRGESPIVEWRSLSTDEQVEEFFFLGLRQREGIALASAHERWGEETVGRWAPTLSALSRDGWLKNREGRVALSDQAYLVSNEIFQQLIGI